MNGQDKAAADQNHTKVAYGSDFLGGRSLKKKKFNGRKWHIFLQRFFILLFVSKIPKDVFTALTTSKWILSTSAISKV